MRYLVVCGMTRACMVIGCGLAGATHSAMAAGAKEPAALEERATVRSTLFGVDMIRLEVAGRQAFILEPPKPKGGGPKPWVWYAPTLLADRENEWKSPGKRHAWIFGQLLAGGVYVVGVDVGESWGSPAGRAAYDKFYELLVGRFGFPPKACLFCVSRGGLMAYNWAAERPDRVRCVGGIYPLVNLQTYGGTDKVARAYGMSERQLRAETEKHNPIDRLRPLAAAGVAILHVHGDQDSAVPLETNSAELARRYQALGGRADVVVIPGKGHEVAPELWQEPRLAEFFLKQMSCHFLSASGR